MHFHPLYFSHANTQQGTAAEEQTGYHKIKFLPLEMIAYLSTDCKNRLDVTRVAYNLSVILITNQFGPSTDVEI